jgi:hypothetical protein
MLPLAAMRTGTLFTAGRVVVMVIAGLAAGATLLWSACIGPKGAKQMAAATSASRMQGVQGAIRFFMLLYQ